MAKYYENCDKTLSKAVPTVTTNGIVKSWELEEEYRFDDEFISLARQVYIANDKRAEIKRKINEETQSSYRELKIY